jgi:predicted ATPase
VGSRHYLRRAHAQDPTRQGGAFAILRVEVVMARPYISVVNPNLFDGKFSCRIEFGPGLNIVSGENGTGKTQLLKLLKTKERIDISGDERPVRSLSVLAINPQRNAERRNLQKVIQEFRRQNKNLDKHLDEITQMELQDSTFVTYPSVAELFYLRYEVACRDGGHQIEKMKDVVGEFNEVITSIFDQFRLQAEWDPAGIPRLQIEKLNIGQIPLEGLSCGEKEILSLVLNLSVARDRDVIIIDEPEVHLNWDLECKLFGFLKTLCEDYGPQCIVATHSRAVFLPEFLPCVQFLYWENGEVHSGQELREEMRRRIAGEAIEIVKLGSSQTATFFVEDEAHAYILRVLAEVLRVNISVSQAGNSENVKSLFKLSRAEHGWRNCYFLIDGDNQGNPFPDATNFIHLDKYCLENYLLDFEICAAVTGKSVNDVQTVILGAIQKNADKIFKKNKYFEFIMDRLSVDDIDQDRLSTLDASEIIHDVIRNLGSSRKRFIRKYIRHCRDNSKLGEVFPERLIEALESAG